MKTKLLPAAMMSGKNMSRILLTYTMSLQNHPVAGPWRTTSFPLFDNIGEIISGAVASGESALLRRKYFLFTRIIWTTTRTTN
ncbi:hypothetical protein PsorP6_004475 [Peronosclerospora sorghi]|uniref:Uncharacterized protein n=1 Tax=Peronosclerospora sorghi TaxID=230839 RepID=A0ACC0VJ91_9STRA|nr:hypothetical protein PsorP6_004475 [Peronosclerospora sorghi]